MVLLENVQQNVCFGRGPEQGEYWILALKNIKNGGIMDQLMPGLPHATLGKHQHEHSPAQASTWWRSIEWEINQQHHKQNHCCPQGGNPYSGKEGAW